MIETRDRAMLGKTTYRGYGYRHVDDLADHVTVGEGEYKTLSAAKLAARSWIPEGATLFVVDRGTYQPDDIVDHEFGVVLNAVWERDPEAASYGHLEGERVSWEQW